MDNKKMQSNILLLITAFIWGVAFVSQRKGMESVGPFTFVSARYLCSAIFLWILILIRDRNKPSEKSSKKEKKTLIAGVICCGICLTGGSLLQQFGLVFTTAGKAAFITALYILLLPIIGIFLGKKTNVQTWVAVALGAIGLYFLTIKEGFSIEKGDFVVLLGTFFWAGHILSVDYFLPKGVDPVKLSFGQMIFTFIISTVFMLMFEKPDMESIKAAALPILYAGIFSGGIGYTFQILAQKNAEPVIASIIMSLESAFGAIAGAIILGEKMVGREMLGSILLFSAVILSQLQFDKNKKNSAK